MVIRKRSRSDQAWVGMAQEPDPSPPHCLLASPDYPEDTHRSRGAEPHANWYLTIKLWCMSAHRPLSR